jgi:2-polyprenyl-6-hydroxyphenyl methylase/3-demethylubiquinone-9 3-methyltransferase
MVETSIRPEEAAHFGAMAADWWDPRGSSAMLHRLNPVRLGFIREAIDRHFGGDGRTLRPLEGHSALDVGCGAGLLAEPLARMGAFVTGIDAAPDPAAFVRALADRLAPGGLLVMSTPNRTPLARLLTITLAEGTGQIPRGTHDYDQFIPPEQLGALLGEAGLEVRATRGIAFSASRGLHLSEDLRLNYLIAASRLA